MFSGSGGINKLVADKVLVAVGRRSYTQGLGMENIGIKLDEKGKIRVRSPDY